MTKSFEATHYDDEPVYLKNTGTMGYSANGINAGIHWLTEAYLEGRQLAFPVSGDDTTLCTEDFFTED